MNVIPAAPPPGHVVGFRGFRVLFLDLLAIIVYDLLAL
jgi:hypothetical protein